MNQQSYQQPMAYTQSNGLAIAGFVCSLVGLLVTGGLLCPIGLVLSLVALGKPNGKGFAVAGIILGLLGSCGLLVALVLIPTAILAALGIGIAAIALAEPEKMELTTDMANIAIAAKLYEEEHGFLPAELSELDLRGAQLTDPWGNRYDYHFIDDDPGFDIVSRGEDGIAGTDDDVRLTRLGETWEAAGKVVVTEADDDSGTVSFTLGDKVITLHGDPQGGRITIDTGDKVIELKGDGRGGDVNVTGKDDPASGSEDGPAPDIDDADSEDEPGRASGEDDG